MGTRADFYIGRGKKAKWLGSVGWDGYPIGISPEIFKAKTKEEYDYAVEGFLITAGYGTVPEHGWPWPWLDSRTTDYAYAWDDGKLWASFFGSKWFDPMPFANVEGISNEERTRRIKAEVEFTRELPKTATFPDMSHLARVTFGPRSGLIMPFGAPPERIDVPTSKVEIHGPAEIRAPKKFIQKLLIKRRPVHIRRYARRQKQC